MHLISGEPPKETSSYGKLGEYLEALVGAYKKIEATGEDIFFFDEYHSGYKSHNWRRILTLLPKRERPNREDGSVELSNPDLEEFCQRYLSSINGELNEEDNELLKKVRAGEIPVFPYTRIHAGEQLHAKFLGNPKSWDAITVEGLEALAQKQMVCIFRYQENY